MNTVILSVTALEDMKRRTHNEFRGERHGARISFASAELLWKVLTVKRWELLRAMGPARAR